MNKCTNTTKQQEHVGQIIKSFILLSNYSIIFPNLYYHAIPIKKIISYSLIHDCCYIYEKHISRRQHFDALFISFVTLRFPKTMMPCVTFFIPLKSIQEVQVHQVVS
jgi:hypothetical protein